MALQITLLLLIVGILGAALRWAIVRARIPFRWPRVLGLSLGLFSLSLPFYHTLIYHRPENPATRVWLAVGAAYLPILLALTLLAARILTLKRRGQAIEPTRFYWWLNH